MVADRAKAWRDEELPTARKEIEGLFAALQSSRDADDFNRHFAIDIVWGNPSGGVISGFETLHSIHERFFNSPMKRSRSRFALVNLVFHGDTVAVAHVRREAIDEHGEVIDVATQGSPYIFHEMAMYVLIRCDGAWWFAAGQNTPLRPNPIRLD